MTTINLTKLQQVQVTNHVSRIYTLPHGSAFSSETNQRAEKYKLYDDCPNCAVAYVLDQNGAVQGRVIIWAGVYNPTLEKPETFTAYSRVYGSSERVKNILRDWCDRHDMVSLERLLGNPATFEGPKLQVDLGFYLTDSMYDEVPWVDYFRWGQQDLPFLFTFRPHFVEVGDYVDLCCLDGHDGQAGFLTGHHEFSCPYCGEITKFKEREWADKVSDFVCPYCVEEFNR